MLIAAQHIVSACPFRQTGSEAERLSRHPFDIIQFLRYRYTYKLRVAVSDRNCGGSALLDCRCAIGRSVRRSIVPIVFNRDICVVLA